MAQTTIESLWLKRAVCAWCKEDTFIAPGQRNICAECGTYKKGRRARVHRPTRIDGTAHIGMWPKREKK